MTTIRLGIKKSCQNDDAVFDYEPTRTTSSRRPIHDLLPSLHQLSCPSSITCCDHQVQDLLDEELLEKFVQIPSEVKRQCPCCVTTVLADWMHRIVQDFAKWIRDVLLLSKLTRIYLSETANLQTTNSDSIDLIIDSCQIVKSMMNQMTITNESKHMIFDLIFGCCQVCVAITRSTELKIEPQRVVVLVDEFFDLIHLSLFSTDCLNLITAEEHFSISQKSISTISALIQTNHFNSGTLTRRLFELGKKSFEFLTMKTDDRKDYRGYGLMNICFKDLVKLLQSQKKDEIESVLHDCFHFLAAALLATSSVAFLNNDDTHQFKVSKFWVVHLCKIVDAFSEDLAPFFNEVLDLSSKISVLLVPKNFDLSDSTSKKCEGVSVVLERLARCMVILLTKQQEAEKENCLQTLIEGSPHDKPDLGPHVLILASWMKSSKNMNDELILISISKILPSTLYALEKLTLYHEETEAEELKLHALNGALRLFSEGLLRHDIVPEVLSAFNSLIWSSSPFICCFFAEFWSLVLKRSEEQFIRTFMMGLQNEIRLLCSAHNAILMDHSSPIGLEISVLSMIQNASFVFLTLLKDLNESIKVWILDELTSSIGELQSISALALLSELTPFGHVLELESRTVQSIVQISSLVLNPKKQDVHNSHGLHLYWNLRLLKALHLHMDNKQKSKVNSKHIVEICEKLFSSSNFHIKTKIWISILKESLEFMNLHFKEVSNWPRIEQTLMTLLRTSESLSFIHYPIFETCQLMATHQLSPQRELMHCLWSHAGDCWLIERLCFQTTIAASRSKQSRPLDLVPSSIYSPNQTTEEQSFMNKMSAMMKRDTSDDTRSFQLNLTQINYTNEELLNTLENSMSEMRKEVEKVMKKRPRVSSKGSFGDKNSSRTALVSLTDTLETLTTLCQDLDPESVTGKKRRVLRNQIGDCLTSLSTFHKKL